MRDLLDLIIMTVVLFAFFALGAWLDRANRGDPPEDYDDE